MNFFTILQQGIWVWCILGFTVLPPLTLALTEEERRTLIRFQEQAETAIGQGDPDGAALTIGKAALLASQIAKERAGKGENGEASTLASLYRTQEHAYRAIALFRQSGSHPPASTGVCQTLTQGIAQSAQSKKLAKTVPSSQNTDPTLPQQIMEWAEMLQELKQEFACGK